MITAVLFLETIFAAFNTGTDGYNSNRFNIYPWLFINCS